MSFVTRLSWNKSHIYGLFVDAINGQFIYWDVALSLWRNTYRHTAGKALIGYSEIHHGNNAKDLRIISAHIPVLSRAVGLQMNLCHSPSACSVCRIQQYLVACLGILCIKLCLLHNKPFQPLVLSYSTTNDDSRGFLLHEPLTSHPWVHRLDPGGSVFLQMWYLCWVYDIWGFARFARFGPTWSLCMKEIHFSTI